jgi:hypothetical protein
MNAQIDEIETIRHAQAIGIWENEGGAPGPGSIGFHHGRWLEVDGSYHVFTYPGGYRETSHE